MEDSFFKDSNSVLHAAFPLVFTNFSRKDYCVVMFAPPSVGVLWQAGHALFNQEKSKLIKTKGLLSESAMLLFRMHHLRFFP